MLTQLALTQSTTEKRKNILSPMQTDTHTELGSVNAAMEGDQQSTQTGTETDPVDQGLDQCDRSCPDLMFQQVRVREDLRAVARQAFVPPPFRMAFALPLPQLPLFLPLLFPFCGVSARQSLQMALHLQTANLCFMTAAFLCLFKHQATRYRREAYLTTTCSSHTDDKIIWRLRYSGIRIEDNGVNQQTRTPISWPTPQHEKTYDCCHSK